MYHLKPGTPITRLGTFISSIPYHIYHRVWSSSTLPPVISIHLCCCTVTKYPASNDVPSNKYSYPCISWIHILRTLLFIPSWPNESPHYLPASYKLVLFLNQGSRPKKGSPSFTITSLGLALKCTLAQKKKLKTECIFFLPPGF